ncbi:MAG: oligopeptidase A [Gammaproteobacteria bacterium]|nr:oligopeptidase A [Gammaproteobacteria bacterium]MDH5650318.1 oligopeptidase A [Gammaproteobacteria bacterium]
MSNPLMAMDGLPPFQKIKPEHIEPAISQLIEQNRQLVDRLLAENEHYTWDNLIQPLEEEDNRLSRAWSPVSHMNSVVNSEALREAYNACLPKLSELSTEMGQNVHLYEAYKSIHDMPEFQHLDQARKKTIENALRDFHLSGVDLPQAKKVRYKEIKQQLSKLTTKYEENLLDATQGWTRQITDESLLAGLPDSARAMARQSAEQKGLEGWLFTLEFPSYYAVMTHADDRELRHEMYQAYVTRASDQGPNAGKWDNTTIMDEILALRHELAQLLGFASFAHRSLATKMAESPEQVLTFLNDLAAKSKPAAAQELQDLRDYAREHDAMDDLQPWDIGYYSEKQRRHLYDISQEALKPYFPESRVIPGMFEVVKRLYNIDIKEMDDVETWHPAVRFYEIRDAAGELRGRFYLDLYAREHKRSGAWMDDCQGRMLLHDNRVQVPVAYLTCNLTPPIGNDPALFTHDEVTTLFHEFGHGLHHMLTQVNHIAVSGINGVAWDAVELPSQFMENWCWEREALNLIAAHYQTGAALPDDLYNKMHAARNFQSGMQMVRQLEFSLFDFRLHLEYDPAKGSQVQQMLDTVRDQVAVIKPPVWNRFQHGFSHIFAGGYAAGYYSYKWAEVLSADAFAKFEEHGIFDSATGAAFLHNILEQGGTYEPMELFIKFRGREPTIDALLRHSGITTE